MATMRILNPTATRQSAARALTPFTSNSSSRRIGVLHNHSPHFDRLAVALPPALQPVVRAHAIDTYIKERYSSAAPQEMLRTIRAHCDVAITGLAA